MKPDEEKIDENKFPIRESKWVDVIKKILAPVLAIVSVLYDIFSAGFWVADLSVLVIFIILTILLKRYYQNRCAFLRVSNKNEIRWFTIPWIIITAIICVNFMARESFFVLLREYFKDARILAFESEVTGTSTLSPCNTPSPFSAMGSSNPNTVTPTFTLTYTETLTPTATSTPTKTLTPTQIKYPDITVGLFDLGESCLNPRVFERLSILGFSVELVPVAISYEEMKNYDVLYLSDGWYCRMDEVESMALEIKQYMLNDGGVLIGNPDVTRSSFKSEILPFDISFLPSDFVGEDWPSYKNCPSCNTHFIINNLDKSEFPAPENIVVLNHGGFFIVTRGSTSGYPSLIIPSSNSHYNFVIMPGGETDISEHYVSDQLLTRVILYLVGDYEDEWID
jgi:hypothetical protein